MSMFSPPLNTSQPTSRTASPSQAESPLSPDANNDPSSSSNSGKPKRSNPLIDLIESEKDYVDLLAGVIRKVASAWSRANFPPSELDAMFRAVEAIYRTNRGFLGRLKEIGPNPTSPKALGDLLMRWIEDLEAPYARYCNSFTTGFDTWDAVQSNPALQPLLDEVTNSHPPSVSPADGDQLGWTLDTLFALPRLRLKYYKKLYARLLKSTQPGRSDHRLLVNANEKLDGLLQTVNGRLDIRLGEDTGEEGRPEDRQQELLQEDAPRIPPASTGKPASGTFPPALPPLPGEVHGPLFETAPGRASLTGSGEGEPRLPPSNASVSSGSDRFSRDNTDNERLSRDTGVTSVSAGRSPSAMSNGGPRRTSGPSHTLDGSPRGPSPSQGHRRSVSEIERAMDTSRVLDIFTMRPKPCKLQIARPVNPLPFARSVKFEADVEMSVTPKATGVEVVYERGHLVMLTDLFLVGEWKDNQDGSGERLWLCFPPLAARHLTVVDEPAQLGEGMDRSFQVQVMRRETIVLRAESPAAKDRLVREFSDAIEKANILAAPPRQLTSDSPNLSGPPTSGPPSRSVSPNAGAIGSPMMTEMPSSVSRSGSTHSHASHRDSNAPSMLSPRTSEHGPMPLPFNRGPNMPYPPPHPNGPPMPGMRGPPGPPAGPPRLGPGAPGPGAPWSPTGGRGPFSPGRPPPPGQGPPQPPMPGGGPPPGPAHLRKSPSGRSLGSTKSHYQDEGPLPPLPGKESNHFLQHPHPGPSGPNGFPPSIAVNGRPGSHYPPQHFGPGPPGPYGRTPMSPVPPLPEDDDSPPPSPVEQQEITSGPSVISAQMKCKVFLRQNQGQWKALGAAKLKLYEQQPKNIKQLVVESESKKDIIISTIVLSDGVERVGKTGIAVELSDKGNRTDIVYMIQLRNEAAASGLFNSLLAGSDRAPVRK